MYKAIQYTLLVVLSLIIGASVDFLYLPSKHGIPIDVNSMSAGSQKILKEQPKGVPLSQEQLKEIKHLEDQNGSWSIGETLLAELMPQWWLILSILACALFIAWRLGFGIAYAVSGALLFGVWLSTWLF
ncbi:MAG: hypothetical protein ACR2JA_12915 [Hydrogenophaga sp.]|uniref:hypothetical protein n=1 Tax=Hydrogenophaga sp. TaxID=1904254 RepID=UPI003D9ACC96